MITDERAAGKGDLKCSSPENGSVRCSSASAGRSHRIFYAQSTITNQLVKRDNHFQAIHDTFLVQLVLLFAFILVRDSYSSGSFNLDIKFFQTGIGSWHQILLFVVYESFILCLALLVLPMLKLWIIVRQYWSSLADLVFLLIYACCMCGSITAATLFSVGGHLPRILSVIIGVEQVRLCMKSYSFIRENAYKVLYPWHKDDDSGPAVWYAGQMSPAVASFSQYCYYLFCPTMLYRDHYPRVPGGIKWMKVIMYFSQFLATLWCAVFIAEEIILPPSLRFEDLVKCFMVCVSATYIVSLLGHTCVLHSWMNMWAELTKFADKKFFEDWWTCTSYSSYYRKWNLIVHDWIHSYMYLDIKKRFGTRLAVILTFTISSLVHEYLLFIAVGFFLPVLTILFVGVGIAFYRIKPFSRRRLSNIFFLFSYCIGFGLLTFCFAAEQSSRKHCPLPQSPSFRDFVTPNVFHCYSQFNA